MAFNQSLNEHILFKQSALGSLGRIPIWLHLAFTAFWAVTIHLIMLWRSPKSNEDFHAERLPLQGSVLWNLICAPLWLPMRFVCSAPMFWSPDPVNFKIFGRNIIVVQGSQNVPAMLKDKNLSSVSLASYLLHHVFGMSRSVTSTHYSGSQYGGGESGQGLVTHQKFAHINRKFLTGPGAAAFAKRFEHNLSERIKRMRDELSDDWIHRDDFFSFFRNDLTAEVINAMCGKALLHRNPGFVNDFWMFSDNLSTFLTRLLWFCAPRAYGARKRALSALKDWQSWARRNFDVAKTEPNGDDECWGSAFFRERYVMMLGLEGYDAEAAASQELAFLYA